MSVDYRQPGPIMTEYEQKKASTKSKFVYPEGLVPAVCSGVIDLGIQKSSYKGEEKFKKQIILLFELIDNENPNEDGSTIKTISKQYSSCNMSLDPNYKSYLQKDLESWRTKPYTEEQLIARFDINQLYSFGCTLNIQKDAKGYFKILMVLPKYKDNTMQPVRAFNADPPEWIQKKINNQVEPNVKEQPTEPDAKKEESFDDDIPF